MQTAVVSPLPSTAASERRGPPGPRLISFAERWFDIPSGSISNPKRKGGNISRARFAVAHVLNSECGYSYPRIADLFNLQDHGGVLRGARKAEQLLRSDEIFFNGVKLLKAEIAPQ
jgi:chromosomal replication initiation ATPase DnaA